MATGDVVVCLGRFQPPQRSHAEALCALAAQASTIVVVCGSSEHPRAVDEPWTAAEREALLTAMLRDCGIGGARLVRLRDVSYDDHRWAEDCRRAIAGVAPAAAITLVGLERRDAADYQALFPGWSCRPPPATAARWHADLATQLLARPPAAAAALLAAHCVPVVAAAIARDLETPSFGALRAEQAHLDDHHRAWAAAPFPPVFVTVDALVTASGQVLLVRRGRAPGAGLLALPGGFVDPAETLREAALRELAEETAIAVPREALAACLRPPRVFDAPFRSRRGRTITHVHPFELGAVTPPPVRGGDDAADALWLPLAALEPAGMFEDHHAILQIMLGV